MESKNSVGFMGLLQLLLIALKLMGYISWPWRYVFMPMWFTIAFSAVVLFVYVAWVVVSELLKERKRSKREQRH